MRPIGIVRCWPALDLARAFLSSSSGNYLEIGIFDGFAIATLAIENPSRCFFGVDPFISDGFANNLNKGIPAGTPETYETILQYKAIERGFHWGTTRETYVQTMAAPDSSTLGNYRIDEGGFRFESQQYHNGIAIGVAWKDE